MRQWLATCDDGKLKPAGERQHDNHCSDTGDTGLLSQHNTPTWRRTDVKKQIENKDKDINLMTLN